MNIWELVEITADNNGCSIWKDSLDASCLRKRGVWGSKK
jgi:hypothetical protein